MDSVTQFVLGAGVGVAVLGRRVGLRKAAVAGGLIATLPDLDIFWPNDDPVDRFVSHRSATHSLIMHALVTPLLGEGLRRLYGALEDQRLRAYLAVFLCLTTHALLDAMTIYGTQLFWPIWPEPLGLGSIFIIDPLYTVPLLVVTIWALFNGSWTPRFAKALIASFVFSTAYLGWSLAAQQIAEARSARALADNGLSYRSQIATPMPFNTLFWHAIAVDGSRYYNVYVPLLGDDTAVTIYDHQRWPDGLHCWTERAARNDGTIKTLADFSDGFYRLAVRDDTLHVADLRMGLTGGYVFDFAMADIVDGVITPTAPRRVGGLRQYPGDLAWLWAGVSGKQALRPKERAERVGGPQTQVAKAAQRIPGEC